MDGLFFFTALYCLTGIPITALAFGNFASKLIEPQESEKINVIIHNKYDEHELKLFEQLGLDGNENSFDRNEFVIFSMVRGNLISIDMLKELFEKFDYLDHSKEKKISFSDLIMRQESLSVDKQL